MPEQRCHESSTSGSGMGKCYGEMVMLHYSYPPKCGGIADDGRASVFRFSLLKTIKICCIMNDVTFDR